MRCELLRRWADPSGMVEENTYGGIRLALYGSWRYARPAFRMITED